MTTWEIVENQRIKHDKTHTGETELIITDTSDISCIICYSTDKAESKSFIRFKQYLKAHYGEFTYTNETNKAFEEWDNFITQYLQSKNQGDLATSYEVVELIIESIRFKLRPNYPWKDFEYLLTTIALNTRTYFDDLITEKAHNEGVQYLIKRQNTVNKNIAGGDSSFSRTSQALTFEIPEETPESTPPISPKGKRKEEDDISPDSKLTINPPDETLPLSLAPKLPILMTTQTTSKKGSTGVGTQNTAQNTGFSGFGTQNTAQNTGFTGVGTQNTAQNTGFTGFVTQNTAQNTGFSGFGTQDTTQNTQNHT